MQRFATWSPHLAEAVVTDPIEIQNEVAHLGLIDARGLIEAVRYADGERLLVTSNDAIGFDAYVMYDKAGRRLRELYLPTGVWVKDDSNNQCAIKNPTTKVRVVPCNFNEYAGDPLIDPTNRSPKGEVSRQKSACNRTAWLPGIPETPPVRDEDGYQTWLLGMFCGQQNTTAEISLPIGFDGKYFTDFGKRIMLITSGDDGDKIKRLPAIEDVPVVDIEIRRKN